MANTPTVFVICDKNCKFEGMTKEQIYAAIVQAVNEGTIGDIDTGFITTLKTINGLPLRFFVGNKAAYDELTDEDKKDLFAIITNDTTKEDIIEAIKILQKDVKGVTNRLELLEGKEKVNEYPLTYYATDALENRIYKATNVNLKKNCFYAISVAYYRETILSLYDVVIAYGGDTTKGVNRQTYCTIKGSDLWVYFPKPTTIQDAPKYVYIKEI